MMLVVIFNEFNCINKTSSGGENKIQEDGIPVYVQALLEQTAEELIHCKKY